MLSQIKMGVSHDPAIPLMSVLREFLPWVHQGVHEMMPTVELFAVSEYVT